MRHSGKGPISPQVKRRLAELVGAGAAYDEAARAVCISDASADRILKDPEYRKIADDLRARRSSLSAQATQVARDLLSAVNHDGSPDMRRRKEGAEMIARWPHLLDSEDADLEDEMLPGVVKHTILVFPQAAPGSVYRDADGVLRGRPLIPDPDAPVTFSDTDLYRPEETP
jgi:hypothetical protein